MTEEERNIYALKNIKIYTSRIVSLEGSSGMLESVLLESGERVCVYAIFFNSEQFQKSDLGSQLNCAFTKEGVIDTDRFQQSNVQDVYVAGDAARDMQLVIIAAAEGAKAGVIINKSLLKEEKNLSPADQTIRSK
ncbi:MAG: FAD-dependent oxidoreductase [Cytophagaceae bacterium]